MLAVLVCRRCLDRCRCCDGESSQHTAAKIKRPQVFTKIPPNSLPERDDVDQSPSIKRPARNGHHSQQSRISGMRDNASACIEMTQNKIKRTTNALQSSRGDSSSSKVDTKP